MAGYPVEMVIETNKSSNNSRRRLNFLTPSQVASLGVNGIVFELDTPLVSGDIISENVSLKLYDNQGRVIVTDNSSIAEMTAMKSNV